MKSIKELKNIKGKRALVRVDFNVPIKEGKVLDDFKIKKTLPTIKFLKKKGAKIILLSHLSDANGSLKPVAECLKKYIKKDITLLENVRRFSGEEKNDQKLAKKLANLGDFYVNDAFGVSHRAHSSLVGVPKYLPSYAGLQLETEIKNLSKVFKNPKHPFLFILGGAKLETKIPLLKKYLKIADNVLIGGVILNTILKAKGYEVGKSLVGETTMVKSFIKNKKIILPERVIVLKGKKLKNKKVNEIEKDEIIVDIDASYLENIELQIKKAKLILWNGPLGKYETGGDKATKKILKQILKSKAEVVIGGGDITGVLSNMKLKIKPNIFVSTGGGATLEFLSKGTLPAIKVLE